MELQAWGRSCSTQSSLRLLPIRDDPHLSQTFIFDKRWIICWVAATNVAWLQVRGDTEIGSPVIGWICSAKTPDGRAWTDTHFMISMAWLKSFSSLAFSAR
jgi:hypothetical protein